MGSIARRVFVIMAACLCAEASARADGLEALALSVNPGGGGQAQAHLLDRCDLLVLPSGAVLTQPRALTLGDLVPGDLTDVTLKVVKSTAREVHPQITGEWVVDEIEIRRKKKVIGHLRASGFVFVHPAPDDPADAQKVRFAHWARVISDRDARARAIAGTLPTVAPLADATPMVLDDSDQDVADELQQARGLLRGDADDPTHDIKDYLEYYLRQGPTLLGSAPGETLAGARGAKAVHGWKTTLVQDGGAIAFGDAGVYGLVTTVRGTTMVKGKPITIPYRLTLVFFRYGLASGGVDSDPLGGQLSIPQ
ncbi:MAG: hypothetical protein K8W52_03405 [Deltaproteobacteria bacterium]|nr:hypothetical protein [Deltaproteobacteria bacterium]